MAELNFPGSRIVNRSQRVWLFGFARMLPGLAVFGPVLILILLAAVLGPNALAIGRIPSAIFSISYLTLIALAVVVDRSALLDPVDVIWLGDELVVKRLVSEVKHIPLVNIKRLDILYSVTRDYAADAEQQATVAIAFRFHSSFKASLLIAGPALPVVREWAMRHQIPLHDELQQTGETPDAR